LLLGASYLQAIKLRADRLDASIFHHRAERNRDLLREKKKKEKRKKEKKKDRV